jgi:hypothetical protein
MCKSRAASSSSIEEIAMHRVLAEFLNQNFAKPGAIDSLRQRMVNNAAAASLSYIPPEIGKHD